jgi:hypothetical protein
MGVVAGIGAGALIARTGRCRSAARAGCRPSDRQRLSLPRNTVSTEDRRMYRGVADGT